MSNPQAVVDEFFETDDWPEIFEYVYEDLPEDVFTERMDANQKRFNEDWIVKDITSKYPSIKFRPTYFDGFNLKHYDRLVW